MLKIEKEYNDLYGEISTDEIDRLNVLLSDINFKREKRRVFDEIKRITSIGKHKVRFTLFLVPKATPRARLGQHGTFYVKGASDNKRIFTKCYEELKDLKLMIVTPCKMHCVAYLPIPKSMNKFEKVLAELGYVKPISKPDWDNLAKTYCDMIQGTLLYDDSLIYDGRMIKKYSIKPRIVVEIEYDDEFESEFNKNKMKKKGLI